MHPIPKYGILYSCHYFLTSTFKKTVFIVLVDLLQTYIICFIIQLSSIICYLASDDPRST